MKDSFIGRVVAEKLRALGAEGLCCSEAECGCVLNDLMPCDDGMDLSCCVPAKNDLKQAEETGGEFWMVPLFSKGDCFPGTNTLIHKGNVEPAQMRAVRATNPKHPPKFPGRSKQ